MNDDPSPDVGKAAPDFRLVGDNGETISQSTLAGRPAVLFFYPQDGSPTCTSEAVAFSQAAGAFREIGVRLIGVSPDSPRSHQNFRRKHGLTVELASDEKLEAIKAFGLWGEKTTFGRTYMGVERATFLIDAQGVIRAAWRKVRLKGHVDGVLKAARQLETP